MSTFEACPYFLPMVFSSYINFSSMSSCTLLKCCNSLFMTQKLLSKSRFFSFERIWQSKMCLFSRCFINHKLLSGMRSYDQLILPFLIRLIRPGTIALNELRTRRPCLFWDSPSIFIGQELTER